MELSRRVFLGGLTAFSGVVSSGAFAVTDDLLLKLGVISDIHIGGRKEAPKRLAFALEWLKAHGVDAVLCPGDIAASGNIRELETFAAIWRSVFGDGRKVELMISTGNHDIAPWPGFYKDMSESERLAQQFSYKDNPSRVWERLFGEKWELVWRKEVKGVTFVGSHWRTLHPPIERYMREHAAEFDPSRPFFYCQHAHPAGTCHGGLGFGDEGEAVRALSAFPNAVAISGHTHCTLADERAVWQGAFTSIGAGCTHEGGAFEPDGHENCTAVWHPTYRQKLMAPLNDPAGQGGDPMGGCFELIDVYADRLVVHRRSSVTDAPIGPDWNVSLPARAGGPFDPAVRNRRQSAPEFAADAVPTVAVCPEGCPILANRDHKGDPCVRVSFPCANANAASRVFDYDVGVKTEEGSVVKTCKVNAPGGTWPEELADVPGDCLIRLSELPVGKGLVFSVTPRNCFGRTGRSICTKPIVVRAS